MAKAAETLYGFRGPSNGGLEPGVPRAPCCWLGHDGMGHTQVVRKTQDARMIGLGRKCLLCSCRSSMGHTNQHFDKSSGNPGAEVSL